MQCAMILQLDVMIFPSSLKHTWTEQVVGRHFAADAHAHKNNTSLLDYFFVSNCFLATRFLQYSFL